jgi:broad specificity phosphatase PhoE
MRLYLARHSDPNPHRDGLTPQGEREAEALASRLQAERITHLSSSVTRRSLATAERISRRTGLPVKQESWLLEPGYLRVKQAGQTYMMWDTFGETVRARTPLPEGDQWFRVPPFDAPEVSAMWAEFKRDCDALTAAHGYVRDGERYRIERRNDERVALISHNGTVLLFIAHLLALPLPLVFCGFYNCPSALTTILFEEHSDAWAAPRALCVADTSHLRLAGLEPQPRGMGSGFYEPYR